MVKKFICFLFVIALPMVMLADGHIVESSISKETKKQAQKDAKSLQKQGWKALEGEKSLDLQLAESQYCQTQLWDDASARFLVQTSTETSESLEMALMAAKAHALAMIAGDIRTSITSLTSMRIENTNGQSTEDFRNESESAVGETLNNCFPVLTMYRQLKNGRYEVQINMVADKQDMQFALDR